MYRVINIELTHVGIYIYVCVCVCVCELKFNQLHFQEHYENLKIHKHTHTET